MSNGGIKRKREKDGRVAENEVRRDKAGGVAGEGGRRKGKKREGEKCEGEGSGEGMLRKEEGGVAKKREGFRTEEQGGLTVA